MQVTSGPVLVAILSSALLTGCSRSKGGPETIEVSGLVTLGGNPVEDANVLFSPALGSSDGRLASQAKTDAQGHYQLSTHIGAGKFKPGIVAGKYVVTASRLDVAGAKNTFATPKNLLPPKYADPKSTPFSAEVSAGKANEFPLALKND